MELVRWQFSLIFIFVDTFTLHEQNDIRSYIPLSSFGFYERGHLIVKISEFALQHGQEKQVVSN